MKRTISELAKHWHVAEDRALEHVRALWIDLAVVDARIGSDPVPSDFRMFPEWLIEVPGPYNINGEGNG